MDMHKELIEKADGSVLRCLEVILPKRMYEYRLVYSGRSIEVLSKNESEDTRLYIRLAYIGSGIAVDLSNINFDPMMQHKGKFTLLIDKLKRSRSIKEIRVSSVLTPEMHKACQKCGMTYSEEIMGYKYTL